MRKHYRIGKINGREVFVILTEEKKTFIYRNMLFVALDINELGGTEEEAERRLAALKTRVIIEAKKQFRFKPWFNPFYWMDRYIFIPSYREILIKTELLVVL